jgi:hypothetical protein
MSLFRAFLKPPPAVHPRTGDETTVRYIRAYLILRILVGGLGIALPFLLVLGDGILYSGDPFPRDSLSAYYYSGVREWFVGALFAFSVFLITYKVSEANLDNLLSLVAGAAVLVVAIFPTSRPDGDIDLTPLQERWGESVVAGFHFAAATLYISLLGGVSYLFGKREGERDPVPGELSPRFWRAFHWICAGVIALALVWCFVTWQFDVGPDEALLYGESVAVWAFGVSWLWKGLEREMLFKRPGP